VTDNTSALVDRPRRRGVALVALAAWPLLATACGSGASNSPAPSPSPSATASIVPGMSRAELASAWAPLVKQLDAGTDFHVQSLYLAEHIYLTGVSYGSPSRSQETYSNTDEADKIVTRETVIRAPHATYYKESQTGASPDVDTGRCWVRETGSSPSQSAEAVRVVDDATPVRVTPDGNAVETTTSLDEALQVDGGHFARDLGITDQVGGTVPMEVRLYRNTILSWSINDGALIKAAVAVGGHRDAFLTTNRTGLDQSEIEGSFFTLGTAGSTVVSAPDPTLTVDHLDRVGKVAACHAPGGS
jgi:hypothetical protein